MERSRLILGLKDFNLVSYAEHVGGGKLADAYKRHNVTGIQSLILDFPTIFVTLQRVRKRLDMFAGGHVKKKFFRFRVQMQPVAGNNQYRR